MEQTRQRSNIVLATEFNLVKISNEDLDKSVQDLVDFSPVYRCLHIYTVLGERDTFELYYRTQRKHQARLVSERQGNASRTLAAYQSYFYQIAGFFVVEDQVLHTTDGLITRETMDDLWDMAVSKVAAVLRAHEAYSQEALLLRHVKELIVWFNQTMQDYGFNVSQMYDILLEMRDLYNEMLMRSWAYIFKDIFQTDDYTPVTVHNEEDYSRMMKQFPYQDLNLHQLDYPKTFPFSGFVPRVYEQVTHFIDESAKFAENLNLSQTDIDNMVRKSVNLLLTRTLNSCLAAMIKQERLRLPQLIQIWTNMTHLEEACPHWEEAISAVTGTALEQLHSARLYGSSIFKDARKDAETELRDQLKGQLNQFFGLANYQWTPSEIASGPSSYITDMVTFLDSSFQTVFKALPEDVAETCCLDACKHIGKTLVGFLASPEESSQINMNGIKSFNWDIIKCEEFAKTCPVQCSDPNMLQSAFEEIRQLVNLFMNMDWSSYVADYRNQYRSKYPRVKPKTIAAVLEKFKESEQKKSIFTFKRGERDRRRFLDTIIKRLHELADTFVSESGTQIPHTDSNM
ncbi:exocyst complex component 6-like [Corticium candelabrum]|uniref:exocyst complex component 6-like n=1 Tax=Corticium candelabrum TaxID=121492 RepID=UPI002E274207|nr:exocyst complex component 6-like [Corticium candelabrum]